MRIERDGHGDFVLDPTEMASRFGVPPEEFRRQMQLGLVTSTVEVGEGEDAGTWRLSLRAGNRIWRAVLNAQDEVLNETLSFIKGSLLPRPTLQ